MTKEERDAVQARCVSIDNIIISIERELRMLRTHLDILTKVCKTEPTISKMEQVDKDINVRSKYEPKICDTCRYYNSNIPCGSTPSACKEADKFAEEFVDGLKKLKPKDEPQTDKDFKVTYTCSFTDCDNFKNFGFGEKCIECKRKQSEAKYKDEPQTDCAWK